MPRTSSKASRTFAPGMEDEVLELLEVEAEGGASLRQVAAESLLHY